MGDVGKSYKMLEICFRVACPSPGNISFAIPSLGGSVVAHGTAVLLTAEDAERVFHQRLSAIDPHEHRQNFPGKLITIAMPDLGGPKPFFLRDPRLGLLVTDAWLSFCEQLCAIDDLKLVTIDPANAFAHLALDVDTTDAQFVCAQRAALASKTGATVILVHHMDKGQGKAPKTAAEARQRIKGNCGIVDGMRLAYAMWQPEDEESKKVCKALGIPFTPNRVVLGAAVKANDGVSRDLTTYVRTDQGLLLDRTSELRSRWPGKEAAADALVEAVRAAAASARAFTLTGVGGLHALRERLPEPLCGWGRDRLEALGRELIEQKRIVRCIAPGANHGKWLDVPGGKFAIGDGEFARGAVDE